MAIRTSIVHRIEPVVLLAFTIPFGHHTFAGDKLFGLNLRRQLLGKRQVRGGIGLEECNGPHLLCGGLSCW